MGDENINLSARAPQILYSLENLFGGFMFLLTNARLSSIVSEIRQNAVGDCTKLRRSLKRVRMMNTLMATAVLLDGAAFLAFNIDIVLGNDGRFSLTHHRLVCAVIISLYNLAQCLSPIFPVLMLYPPTSMAEIPLGKLEGTVLQPYTDLTEPETNPPRNFVGQPSRPDLLAAPDGEQPPPSPLSRRERRMI